MSAEHGKELFMAVGLSFIITENFLVIDSLRLSVVSSASQLPLGEKIIFLATIYDKRMKMVVNISLHPVSVYMFFSYAI